MILTKEQIDKIKEIIERHHTRLVIGALGREALTQAEILKLTEMGIDVSRDRSILEDIYYHNYLNEHGDSGAPKTHSQIQAQQTSAGPLPKEAVHEASKEYLNANMKQLIEKQKSDVLSRIEGIIRDRNNLFKFDKQQDLEGLTKEKSIGALKTELRDYSREANRNWDRIVHTEVSNAISLGSVDRIVDENKDVDLDEIYVYRIVVNDAALCKYCRRFYLDRDGSPKVYRMSDLLANGSNYGKKASTWKPVATATHPNERCSQVIELKPGWKVLPGGAVTFMGREDWAKYIKSKVQK